MRNPLKPRPRTASPPSLSPSDEEILDQARRGIIDDRDDADAPLLREGADAQGGERAPGTPAP